MLQQMSHVRASSAMLGIPHMVNADYALWAVQRGILILAYYV